MFRPVTFAQRSSNFGGVLPTILATHHQFNLLHRIGLALEATFAVLIGVMVDKGIANDTEGERIPVLRLALFFSILILSDLCGAVELGDSNISDALESARFFFWLLLNLRRSLLLLVDTANTRGLSDARKGLAVISGRGIALDLDILDILVQLVKSLFLIYGELIATVVLDCFTSGVFPLYE